MAAATERHIQLAFDSNQVDVGFRRGEITSEVGLVLLREFDERLKRLLASKDWWLMSGTGAISNIPPSICCASASIRFAAESKTPTMPFSCATIDFARGEPA